MISFFQCLFYFLMFAGNAFFVVYNGTTTLLSHMSSGMNTLGLALAFAQMVFFAPGAHKFVDGLFRFKYGINK